MTDKKRRQKVRFETMFMMNSHNPVSRTHRNTPHMYFPRKMTTKCMYCRNEYLILNETAVDVFSYSQRRPFICPLCRLLLEQSDKAIETETSAHDPKDDLTVNHYALNEMEAKNNDRYDEKSEPDEASEDEHEELRRLLENAGQGGSSNGSGNGGLQDDADGPYLYLILNIVLIRAMIPLM